MTATMFEPCRGCAPIGRCRLGVGRFTVDGDELRAEVVCAASYQAGPDVAHGGWIAYVFDDVLGRLPRLSGARSVTGSLDVRFVRPVPVERPLVVVARIVERRRRRRVIEGVLRLESTGAELARARGVWVARPDDHFDRHQQWLAAQDTIGIGDATEPDEDVVGLA